MAAKYLMLIVLVSAAAFIMVSCGKKENASDEGDVSVPAVEAVEGSGEEITQTVCPVMGNKINKDLWVEHNGKKIYFCCAGCPEAFKKNPEKYMKNIK